jgi:hypothetical protein
MLNARLQIVNPGLNAFNFKAVENPVEIVENHRGGHGFRTV